jgi:hypothetical protein
MISKLLVGGAIMASALLITPGAAFADTQTPTPNPPSFYCVGTQGHCGPAGDTKKKVEPAKAEPDKCDTADYEHPPSVHFGHPLPDVTSPLPAMGHAVCEAGKGIPKK